MQPATVALPAAAFSAVGSLLVDEQNSQLGGASKEKLRLT